MENTPPALVTYIIEKTPEKTQEAFLKSCIQHALSGTKTLLISAEQNQHNITRSLIQLTNSEQEIENIYKSPLYIQGLKKNTTDSLLKNIRQQLETTHYKALFIDATESLLKPGENTLLKTQTFINKLIELMKENDSFSVIAKY